CARGQIESQAERILDDNATRDLLGENMARKCMLVVECLVFLVAGAAATMNRELSRVLEALGKYDFTRAFIRDNCVYLQLDKPDVAPINDTETLNYLDVPIRYIWTISRSQDQRADTSGRTLGTVRISPINLILMSYLQKECLAQFSRFTSLSRKKSF
ncbi:MAG: hypothetical protein H9993_07105, partial [Candidatus Desulfovibrio faecigallinarum]|nr:hypothetical protein [Candidatus Desulfovibrio faecigallinarum]